MPSLLFDTSALAKYYHTESGSSNVIDWVNDPDNRCYISRLSLVECHSVFARRVREGKLSEAAFQQWQWRFYADLRRRTFRVIRFSPMWERDAMRLIADIGPSEPLRALDAMQLAVALWLRDQDELDQFICSDRRLAVIAARQDLTVINPEAT